MKLTKQELLDAFANEISLGSFASWKEDRQMLNVYKQHISVATYLNHMERLASLAEKMSKELKVKK